MMMSKPRLAAVLYSAGSGAHADTVLTQAVGMLRAGGCRLGGAVQHNTPIADRCACDMTLEDLGSGRLVDISENRGPHARGCRLNSLALEELTGLAATAIAAGVDLLVVNKFGKRETEGHGFRQAIETAVASGVPVIALVSHDNLAGWEAFTQGLDDRLSPDVQAIISWCHAVIGREQAVAAV